MDWLRERHHWCLARDASIAALAFPFANYRRGQRELAVAAYAAGRVEPVMTGASCSGITSERVTLFRAFDLHRTGKGGGVAHEDITVHEIPLVEVVTWLEANRKSAF